ncbi:hypothetical protein B0H19DRAFT_1151727 [Mycena capillaripes]|nr:hypothetical protein B0H19DRAFT_1151727 [Mycena capillaripes]
MIYLALVSMNGPPLLAAALFLFLGVSCHPTTSSPPAKRLTLLKPRKPSSLAGYAASRGHTVIDGLLLLRRRCQSEVCQGDCCDEGSSCCGDTACCDNDDNCCEGGTCCSGSDRCAVADNGDEGCCPVGEDCSGSPDECDTSGYVPCSNEHFCCPECAARDSDDNPTCVARGGGGQPSIQTLTPTSHAHSLPTSDGSQSQNNGVHNVSVDLSSDTGITWSGDWGSVGSSCSSSRKGKSLSGTGTNSSSGVMSYSFTGPSVYLSFSGSNAWYTVSIDGEEINSVSLSAQNREDCTMIWWRKTDLSSGSHDLEVTVSGVNDTSSSSSDLQQRGLIDWGFDILQLIVTVAASGLLSAGSSNVASWPLVLFSALVCLSPYV